MNHQITIGGVEITLSGLKKEIEYMKNKLDYLKDIKKYHIDLTGPKERPDEQHRTQLMAFFGSYDLRNEEGFIAACKHLGESLPIPLKLADFNTLNIGAKVSAIFKEHVCIIDNTTSAEQRFEADQKHLQERKEYEANELLIKNTVNLHSEEIIPATEATDKGVVWIGAYYDDSDVQSDYFNRHANLIGGYVLGILDSAIRSEAAMRSVIEQVDELKGLEWTYCREEHSMGHGVFMESQNIGVVKKKTYDGRNEAPYWYEIKIGKWNGEGTLKKSRLFVDMKSVKTQASESATNAEGVSIMDYSEKAIVVYGETKPVKDTLKALGGRFNFRLTNPSDGSNLVGWIFPKTKNEQVRTALGLS